MSSISWRHETRSWSEIACLHHSTKTLAMVGKVPGLDAELPRVSRRRPPGSRSAVRIRKRLASKRSDRVPRLEDATTIPAPGSAGGLLMAS